MVLLPGMALLPAPARAQFYEAARQSLGLSPDPIARSPRLLGLGRLTLVVPDVNNRITMWDFAGNPTGLLDADSTSTLAFRPGSSSAASVRDVSGVGATIERQDLAAREVRLGYEAWRRRPGASAFGAIGDFGVLRLDRPFNGAFERRSRFSQPNVMAVLNGRLPYVKTARALCALRAVYGFESAVDEYRLIERNAAGEYVDRDGQLAGPPDAFAPDDTELQMQGAGAAVSVRVARWLTLAAGADAARSRIKSENRGERYVSERRETRPVGIGQASAVGRIGNSFEYGVDGRGWTSASNETWVFTISTNTGGAGATPLAGRGDLNDRRELGSKLRTRARWTIGPLELGGSYGTAFRRVKLTPRLSNGRNSFNALLDSIYYRTRADTTTYPDSAVFNRTEDRSWEAAGGLAYQLPGGRGVVGVEYHRGRDLFQQTLTGLGPKRVNWDVRGGIEYRCNPVFTGRAGYVHRWEDRDDFTRQNEYVGNGVTLGMGLRPAGSIWSFESGYAFEWSQADYGSPARPRGTRQQLAAQVQWVF